jgi:hypothetical protein
MQTKQLSFFLSLLLTLCLFHDTQAQQAGRIESMKLLTADTGWAATNKKLFWTTNGGARWSDITPRLEHKQQAISSVFFLDSSTGWVLLSCSDGRDLIADDVCFEFRIDDKRRRELVGHSSEDRRLGFPIRHHRRRAGILSHDVPGLCRRAAWLGSPETKSPCAG